MVLADVIVCICNDVFAEPASKNFVVVDDGDTSEHDFIFVHRLVRTSNIQSLKSSSADLELYDFPRRNAVASRKPELSHACSNSVIIMMIEDEYVVLKTGYFIKMLLFRYKSSSTCSTVSQKSLKVIV